MAKIKMYRSWDFWNWTLNPNYLAFWVTDSTEAKPKKKKSKRKK